jgi:hypothetical protein
MSAQSALASMKTVKRAALAARFALTRRVAPERFRDHSFLPPSLFPLGVASAAGTVRPDDPPSVRRYDAFLHERAVGAIGIVFVTVPTIVAISRPDAEAERADLNARPSGVRAHVDLSGGWNRRNEQSACCRGHQ